MGDADKVIEAMDAKLDEMASEALGYEVNFSTGVVTAVLQAALQAAGAQAYKERCEARGYVNVDLIEQRVLNRLIQAAYPVLTTTQVREKKDG